MKHEINRPLFGLAIPGLVFLLAFYYAPLFGLIIPFFLHHHHPDPGGPPDPAPL